MSNTETPPQLRHGPSLLDRLKEQVDPSKDLRAALREIDPTDDGTELRLAELRQEVWELQTRSVSELHGNYSLQQERDRLESSIEALVSHQLSIADAALHKTVPKAASKVRRCRCARSVLARRSAGRRVVLAEPQDDCCRPWHRAPSV